MKKTIFLLTALLMLCCVNCYAENAGEGLITLAEITAEADDGTSGKAEYLKMGVGRDSSYFQADNAEFPSYIKLDFGGIDVSVNSISIFTKYGISYGITSFYVEALDDDRWVRVSEDFTAVWDTDTVIAEKRTFDFSAAVSKKFRIVINRANSSDFRIDALTCDGAIVGGLSDYDVMPAYRRTRKGYKPDLPATVKIRRPDMRVVSADVAWEDFSPDLPGTYSVYGSVAGSNVKARTIVDVYDNRALFENDILQMASAYGYYVAEEKLLTPAEASGLMFSAFNMDFEEFPSDYSERDGNDFIEHMEKYVTFDGNEVTEIKAAEALVTYAKCKKYEITDDLPSLSGIDSLSPTEQELAENAVMLGILKTEELSDLYEPITADEFLKLCFRLKKTAEFVSVVTEDNGAGIHMKNAGSVISSDGDVTDADVIYINKNKQFFEDGEKYDFSLIDTYMVNYPQKQLAFSVSDADEKLVQAMYRKYGESGRVAFIDTDNKELWSSVWTDTNIYSETGNTRDGGRFVFGSCGGCRIFPSEIKYSKTCNHDEGFLFKLTWQNSASVSADRDIYPTITLKDENDNIVTVMTDADTNLSELASGESLQLFAPPINGYLPGGTYKAYISLGSISGKPETTMPVDLENDGQNRYFFGRVELVPISKVRVTGFSDNTLKINVGFGDYRGDYDSVNIGILLKEQDKGIFGLNGDMLLAKFTGSNVFNALSKGESCNLSVKINFSDKVTLRNKEIDTSELAGRSFDVMARTSAITKGHSQWRVIGYGDTMQKLGVLTVNDDLTLSFSAEFEEVNEVGVDTKISGSYSMPEECTFRDGNIFTSQKLCDGKYTGIVALNAESRDSETANCTYDFDKQYVQIEFDGQYKINRFLLGSTSNAKHYCKSGITKYSISYYDDFTGKWVKGEENVTIGPTSQNGDDPSEYSLMITLQREYNTSKIRFHIASSYGGWGPFTVLSELVPFGTKVPEEDKFAGYEFLTGGVRLAADYEVADPDNSTGIYVKAPDTSSFNDDGTDEAAVMFACESKVDGINKYGENAYVQMNFDGKRKVSALMIGAGSSYYNTSAVKKLLVLAYNDEAGTWGDGEIHYLDTYDKDEWGNYKRLILLDREYETSKIRVYVLSSFNQTDFAVISELTAFEKIGTDHFVFKDNALEKVADFADASYGQAETAGYENARYYVAMYDEEGILLAVYCDPFQDRRAKVADFVIPETAKTIKTFVFENEYLKPLRKANSEERR